ncbi:MAG TPA: ROK family protein [Firmicutes bacterium]|nr:ROK family protein [Bacillota bacterium]
MNVVAGVDIGGTKCAISLGKATENSIEIIDKLAFPTPESPDTAIQMIIGGLRELLMKYPESPPAAIGISCGGPLDSKRGLILSPPNLPNWDSIDVFTPFVEQFHIPVGLQNDANACALAEWRWGAGRGCKNMIFLTFGTGMGAGLILDGRLYTGTNDMAGEVGHIRLERDGPVGYGKAGSFEGFCSGGGIAQLAKKMAEDALDSGKVSLYCPTREALPHVTTKKVGEAAQMGDPLALEVFRIVGRKLGRGLAILVDILNPEKIIIGSIYVRQKSILEPIVIEELKREALGQSLSACQIVPAGLGENVGDFASLSVAAGLIMGT